MDSKLYIAIGLSLVMLAVFSKAAAISGSCSFNAYQCDLTVKELEVCNTSSHTEHYSVSESGEAADWLNVVPDSFSLASGDCKEINVYAVASCMAEPGIYSATIEISNGSTAKASCVFEVLQGHLIELDVEPESVSATQGEEKTYEILITNNSKIQNQQTEMVYLSINGLPAEWYDLEKSSVIVTKGSTETVLLKVTASEDADFGVYEFEVYAELENPSFNYSTTAEFILGQGQEANMDSFVDNYNICRESGAEANFSVSNTGKLDDEYVLSLSAPSWVSLSDRKFELANGETKEVKLVFNPTQNNADSYDATLRVASTKYNYEIVKEFSIDLQDCYNLEVELKGDVQEAICVEDTPVYEFEVKNTGTQTADVKVEISGVNGQLSVANLSVPSEGSSAFSAELDVSDLLEKGKASFSSNVAIELIVDSTGSMLDEAYGKKKIDVAKESLSSFVESLAAVNLGLRVFGINKGCAVSELLMPISKLDVDELKNAVNALAPNGKTNIGEALRASMEDFPQGSDKYILLISDGKESCESSLEEDANALKTAGIKVYAIGFDIDVQGKEQLESIAETTSGKYFDAGNEAELVEALDEITTELNISKADSSESQFTITLVGEDFVVVKNYPIEVQDCYNAAIVPKSFSLCNGIATENKIEVENFGQKDLVFTVSALPPWISADSQLEVKAMSTGELKLTIDTPEESSATNVIIELENAELSLQKSFPINYLSSISCFRIELIAPKMVDANVCTAQEFELKVINKGAAKQTITLSVDENWVDFVPKELELESGEEAIVYIVASPPLDLALSEFTVIISAETDRGFKVEKAIVLKLLGLKSGLDVSQIKAGEGTLVDSEDKEKLGVSFVLVNDTNREVVITAAELAEFEGSVDLQGELVLGSGQNTELEFTFALPEEVESDVLSIPVVFYTDAGKFSKEVDVNVATVRTEAYVSPTGFISVANLGISLVMLLVIIVVVLVAYALARERKAAGKKTENAKPAEKPAKTAKKKGEKKK